MRRTKNFVALQNYLEAQRSTCQFLRDYPQRQNDIGSTSGCSESEYWDIMMISMIARVVTSSCRRRCWFGNFFRSSKGRKHTRTRTHGKSFFFFFLAAEKGRKSYVSSSEVCLPRFAVSSGWSREWCKPACPRASQWHDEHVYDYVTMAQRSDVSMDSTRLNSSSSSDRILPTSPYRIILYGLAMHGVRGRGNLLPQSSFGVCFAGRWGLPWFRFHLRAIRAGRRSGEVGNHGNCCKEAPNLSWTLSCGTSVLVPGSWVLMYPTLMTTATKI